MYYLGLGYHLFLKGHILQGFLGGSVIKNPAANAGDVGLILWLRRSPGEEWQPTPSFLPGKFHRQRRLGATIHGFIRVAHNLETKQQQHILHSLIVVT